MQALNSKRGNTNISAAQHSILSDVLSEAPPPPLCFTKKRHNSQTLSHFKSLSFLHRKFASSLWRRIRQIRRFFFCNGQGFFFCCKSRYVADPASHHSQPTVGGGGGDLSWEIWAREPLPSGNHAVGTGRKHVNNWCAFFTVILFYVYYALSSTLIFLLP